MLRKRKLFIRLLISMVVIVISCCILFFPPRRFCDIKKGSDATSVGQRSFSQRMDMSISWKASENRQVFILGASGVNTSTEWDTFHIYGQWYYTDSIIDNSFMKCCFIFNNIETIQTNVTEYGKPVHMSNSEKLKMWYVICPNPSKGKKPEWVSIATKHLNFDCKSTYISYVRPFFPLKQNTGSLVIGTKSVYANINAEMVVSWMETYKYLGVDKVVTYKLKEINAATAKVLDYYASTDILDLFVYDLADDINLLRNISHKGYQTWSDQGVIMLDYFERYSGFTFSGIIDHDEFLIPAFNRTLKEMLACLFNDNRNASSFRFKSEYFITSQKQPTNDFLKQYITRSSEGPIWDRSKLLVKTADKLPGPTTEHFITSREGTRTFDCPVNAGYIRHYRKCVLDIGPNSECRPGVTNKMDMSMATWAKHIEDNVKHVLKTVLHKN